MANPPLDIFGNLAWLNKWIKNLLGRVRTLELNPASEYKVYSFGLKGNTFYFPTVFENTLNSDIVYAKVSPGIFTLTSASNCFIANKTMILPLTGKYISFADEAFNNLFMSIGSTTGQVSIAFYANVAGSPGAFVDPVMPTEGITLEIRVYN